MNNKQQRPRKNSALRAIAAICMGMMMLGGCAQEDDTQQENSLLFYEDPPLSQSCRDAQGLYEAGKFKEFMNSPCVHFVWGMSAGAAITSLQGKIALPNGIDV